MKTLSTILSLSLSLSFSLSHSLTLILTLARGKNVSRQSLARSCENPPRDNHVLARPRPNFDLKFLHGFIQKYIYTYTVGVYVTLRPYSVHPRPSPANRFDGPAADQRMDPPSLSSQTTLAFFFATVRLST